MNEATTRLFGGYFDTISDPRIERTRLHPLREIMAIVLCAVICGADGWNDIEEFGNAKHAWFRTFLHLMDRKAAIPMVSAWASANHLVLGQVKVEAKSNEITAIPALLKAIEIAGCIGSL